MNTIGNVRGPEKTAHRARPSKVVQVSTLLVSGISGGVFLPLTHMPNHVHNIVTVKGDPEVVGLLDRAVKSEEMPMDFERIVSEPSIVTELSSVVMDHENINNHPGRSTLDWRVEHWGTKWNAYDFGACGLGRYEFFTAWDPPLPIVAELSRLFPELTIQITYHDPFDDESRTITFPQSLVPESESNLS